jgi:hypothetical protein
MFLWKYLTAFTSVRNELLLLCIITGGLDEPDIEALTNASTADADVDFDGGKNTISYLQLCISLSCQI